MASKKSSKGAPDDKQRKAHDAALSKEGWSHSKSGRLPIQKWGAGLVVIGTLVGTKKLPDKGEKKGGTIFYVDTEDGTRECYGAPAILAEALTDVRPGELVRVECLGKVPSTKGDFAWDFDVRVKESD